MRICHLSWEYPPLLYGGLGRHVHALSVAQAAAGHDVTVVTQADPAVGAPPGITVIDGVRVVRVTSDAPELPFDVEHLLPWVLALEHALTRAVAVLPAAPDVIHAHDWLVAHTAMTARTLTGAPIVATFHATEAGRHQGWLPGDLSRAIHSVEWWLANNAARIICCSEHMRSEVTTLFGGDSPALRVDVVPNGIDLATWKTTRARVRTARERFAPDGEPLLVFSGRLEWEKGVHTLLDALPAVRRRVPGVRLVIAGRGSKVDDMRAQVRRLRLGRAVTFAGWLPETDLHALVAAADCAVVPSLYEPSGLVALEAAALGTPLVVARSGGLAEFVVDGVTGWTYAPGDVRALGVAIEQSLTSGDAARRVRAAKARLRSEFTWETIAAQTAEVYRRARSDHRRAPRDRDVAALPAPMAYDGNLLRAQ